MEESMWLISLIGSSGTVLAAVGAVLAAVAAWRSAKETQKTVLAQILMQIMDAYSSKKICELF